MSRNVEPESPLATRQAREAAYIYKLASLGLGKPSRYADTGLAKQ